MVQGKRPEEKSEFPAPEEGDRIYLIRIRSTGEIWNHYIDIPAGQASKHPASIRDALSTMSRSLVHTLLHGNPPN